MTRKEVIRQTHQADTLRSLGFTSEETDVLRRISLTLRRWYERECGDGNGWIERDEHTHVPYWHSATSRYVDPHDPRSRWRIPDRETGARRRLKTIIMERNQRVLAALPDPGTFDGCVDQVLAVSVEAYLQTDPRGAALYILRPGDVPEGADVAAYYSRGICVY